MTQTKQTCPNGTWCTMHSNEHHSMFDHPFNIPCKYGHTCTNFHPEHKNMYSHLCNWGQNCTRICDPEHTKNYFHVKLQMCPDNFCPSIFDIFHRMQFSHTGMPDIMTKCKFGLMCRYYDTYIKDTTIQDKAIINHVIEFYHNNSSNAL